MELKPGNNSRRIRFYTLGCKVNQYETQALREQLLNAGYKEDQDRLSDIYIINTCTVTEQADRESLRLIKKALRSNPCSRLIVTGCLVEKDASVILQISDKIQIVPNQYKHRIADFLSFTHNTGGMRHKETFIPLRISRLKDHQRVFVKIQDGCNNLCSYCKVSLVRGTSRSRSLKEIIEETSRIVNAGFKEIILTGICLGDYHYGNFGLAEVLTALKRIEGDFRIRLSSIEPQLINDRLIEHLNSAKVCPQLHIPLQSGDDAILKKMNRRYCAEEYLSLIAKVKKKVKDIAITTDILVGFPGEKEKNLRNTVRCLKEVLPLRTHIFPFSPRRGTKAFDFPGQLKSQVLRQRVNLLKQVALECSYKFRRPFLGRELTVLIESKADKKTRSLCGYSENYIRVAVKNATQEDINKLLKVKVETISAHSTEGRALGRGVASF